jgi:hypothetical protein
MQGVHGILQDPTSTLLDSVGSILHKVQRQIDGQKLQQVTAAARAVRGVSGRVARFAPGFQIDIGAFDGRLEIGKLLFQDAVFHTVLCWEGKPINYCCSTVRVVVQLPMVAEQKSV